jgi:Zn-finger protein
MEHAPNVLFAKFLLEVVEHKMHEMANEIIAERNTSLIEEWDFEKRKKENPHGCICYEESKKCHDMEDLNCFFCYCPEYDRTIKEGGCKIDSSKGKYIDNHEGKIWDCSDCDFPHKKENALRLLENLFK